MEPSDPNLEALLRLDSIGHDCDSPAGSTQLAQGYTAPDTDLRHAESEIAAEPSERFATVRPDSKALGDKGDNFVPWSVAGIIQINEPGDRLWRWQLMLSSKVLRPPSECLVPVYQRVVEISYEKRSHHFLARHTSGDKGGGAEVEN